MGLTLQYFTPISQVYRNKILVRLFDLMPTACFIVVVRPPYYTAHNGLVSYFSHGRRSLLSQTARQSDRIKERQDKKKERKRKRVKLLL